MKKNLFRIVLTVVFIFLAIYLLWPTYKDYTFNKELEKLSGQDSLDYVERNSEALRNARDSRIKLGLDLKGGMYVVLDVDVVKLLNDVAKQKDEVLTQTLTELQAVEQDSDEPILDLLKARLREKGKDLKAYYGEVRDSEADVETRLQSEIDNAIDRAVEIVRNRVDQYGVAEPQIQKSGGRRIVLELPGVSNPEEVRKLLQGTALLEFKLVYDPEKAFKVMEKINNVLAGKPATDTATIKTSDIKVDSTKTPSLTQANDSTKKDTSKTKTTAAQNNKKDSGKTTTTQNIKKDTTKRNDTTKKTDTAVNPTPTTDTTPSATDTNAEMTEEEFKAKNPFFALVNINPQSGTVDGYIRSIDKDKVVRLLNREDIKALIPTDLQFVWSNRTFNSGGENFYMLYTVKRDAELTGKVVTNARSSIDPTSNVPVVSMEMNDEGAADWARITGANINKRVAIVLDSVVYSAPVVRSKITGGNSQIEGMENIQEAKLLEIILKAGALPAPVKIIEERTVGPSLGEDSIRAGILSAVAALFLVALFMIVYYKFGGSVADLALVINVLFILGIMAAFKATLTVPGIAGLILTLGMAVDTNVLIFERIREELGFGKPLKTAVDIGYKKAFSAILDSHITSIITGIILYQFGTGPIQGFALILLFGICANLFTAIVITHIIIDAMLEKGKSVSFG